MKTVQWPQSYSQRPSTSGQALHTLPLQCLSRECMLSTDLLLALPLCSQMSVVAERSATTTEQPTAAATPAPAAAATAAAAPEASAASASTSPLRAATVAFEPVETRGAAMSVAAVPTARSPTIMAPSLSAETVEAPEIDSKGNAGPFGRERRRVGAGQGRRE
jgi:hypothetical protein